MTDSKLPDLKKQINFQDGYANDMLERACILNNAVNLNRDVYFKTAKILSKVYKADVDTVIASLIYGYVQVSGMQDSEVKGLFNDGLLSKVNILKSLGSNLILDNKEQDEFIKSITKDVKVTIIKLVERLVMFSKINENNGDIANIVDFIETFDISICKTLGIYKLKNAFENICFKYNPNYKKMLKIKNNIADESRMAIKIVKNKLEKIDSEEKKYIAGIKFHVNIRSLYEVSELIDDSNVRLSALKNRENIESSGICSIKCLVDNKNQCYHALYFIHQFLYQADTFTDYLNYNIDNEYHSMHTKVFIKSLNKTYLVNFRICTKDMDRVNNYGIASNWQNDDMQTRLENNYSFYKELLKIIDSDDITTPFLEMINDKYDRKDIKTYINKRRGE